MQEILDLDTDFLFSTLDIMLWVITAGVLLIFTTISIILYHHWKEYGVGKKQIKRLVKIYFGVSGILLIAMITSLLMWII